MMHSIWGPGQEELFPCASKIEQVRVKKLLSDYRKMKHYIMDYEQKGIEQLPHAQLAKYQKYKKITDDLDRAAALILDDEERDIMIFRYLQGNRHKTTVLRYRGIMDERTVDRRLEGGIESIANTLKLWES